VTARLRRSACINEVENTNYFLGDLGDYSEVNTYDECHTSCLSRAGCNGEELD
jgi:hypothetical protein